MIPLIISLRYNNKDIYFNLLTKINIKLIHSTLGLMF